jgi:hypothetical protein
MSRNCSEPRRNIEAWCDRKFWLDTDGAPTERTFAACHWYVLDLGRHEIGATDDITVQVDASGDGTFETTLTSGQYLLEPVNAPNEFPEAKPYTRVRAVGTTWPSFYGSWSARPDRVKITARYGWPAVPEAVTQAALLLAAETFKLRDAHFGVAGFSEQGFSIRVRDNPKAVALLAPYRRVPVLAA